MNDPNGSYGMVFGYIMKDIKHLHKSQPKQSCMSCGHVNVQQIQYVLIMAS